MAAKIKIADFRKAYDGLDWARDWNQGGSTAENLRCDLATQLKPRIDWIRELLAIVPSRYTTDIDNAKGSLERAERAILRNQLGRATLFQILGSEEIPAGQYPEALQVATGAIRAFVDALEIGDVSPMVHNLQRFRIFEDGSKFIGSWILPAPDATPSNCVKFPGK